jgi:hypothetical protein
MLNTAYYCKSVTISSRYNISEYIFNHYGSVIEDKEDSFPVNLNKNDLEELTIILKADTAKLFHDSSIKLVNGIIFFLMPFEHQPIHIDAQTKHGMYTSLNIPLLNCEGGSMSWYSGNYYEEDIILPSGIRYAELKIEDPKTLYNQIINDPCVVRTSIPHNVQNNIGKKRIMLALRYNKNIPELVDYEI